MRARTAVIMIVFCIMLSGFKTSASAEEKPSLLVTTEWLAEHLNDPSLLLFHVGPKNEYDEAHIPGAQSVSLRKILLQISDDGLSHEMPPLEDLKFLFESLGVSDDSRIVIYSVNDWTIPLAARIYVTLDYLGLGDRTSLLDGGLIKWRDENRPLTSEVPDVAFGEITLKPNVELIVSTEWVEKNLRNPDVVIVDARPDESYDGESGDDGRQGHIAGAVSIPIYTLTEEESPYNFKSTEELAKTFIAHGAKPGSIIAAYCDTGILASLVYFAAKQLGYEARLYDGSFEAWSREAELPVIGRAKKILFR